MCRDSRRNTTTTTSGTHTHCIAAFARALSGVGIASGMDQEKTGKARFDFIEMASASVD